ncbi:hypothetical protein NKK48_08150 [Mesorhizobium sp. C386A]|uniref:hypothetical protein n=1 Tax=unclassified Mesorhizobium TaxID=325217 RepID=UPI001FD87780|nr:MULTISPECIES: hypothetical protein [unclassified Mesorhizobium]
MFLVLGRANRPDLDDSQSRSSVGADRSSAVIVVVETNPKGIATEFSCDGSAKATPSINPGRFSDRRSGFVVHGNLPASVVA